MIAKATREIRTAATSNLWQYGAEAEPEMKWIAEKKAEILKKKSAYAN